MEENKNSKSVSTVSKIVGALVESDASALEALEVLEKAKQTFLERSWHISSNKKSPQVAGTTSEDSVEIVIPKGMRPIDTVRSIEKHLAEHRAKLPLDF